MEFELTKNQQQLFDAAMTTQAQNFIFTGKPGVGKSVLIRAITEARPGFYTLAAPTGLAALNIGGKTLHSIFRLPVSQGIVHPTYNRFPDDKTIKHIKYNVKNLIIDEISMVRADMFDYIDRLCRYAKEVDAPFGGIQVIGVGDFFQLPPVVQGPEKIQLADAGYRSAFVFDSKVFAKGNFKVMQLTEVLRQKGDATFISILDSARTGDITLPELRILNKQVNRGEYDMRIRLTGTNPQADEINRSFLSEMEEPSKFYRADKYGEWPALPVEETVELRVGAQVMVKMNKADKPENYKGEWNSPIVNGTIGKVKEMLEDRVIIETEDGNEYPIFRKTWERKVKEQIGGKWEETVVAYFEQIPLSLAWAISIHKSQGQSFEKCHIDASKIFAPGQIYVALSRCRSLTGMSLESALTEKKFFADPNVKRFYESIGV